MTAFINSYTSPNSLDYKISTPILKPIRGLKAQHYILKEFLSIYKNLNYKKAMICACDITTISRVLSLFSEQRTIKSWQNQKRCGSTRSSKSSRISRIDGVQISILSFYQFWSASGNVKNVGTCRWGHIDVLSSIITLAKIFLNMNLLRSKNIHFWVNI